MVGLEIQECSSRTPGAPWRPAGGRLGTTVGGAALVAGWVASESAVSRFVSAGDDGVTRAAIAVAMLLAVATLGSMALLIGRWRHRASEAVRLALVAVSVAAIVAARSWTHEIAVERGFPAAGGVDPIVRVGGIVVEPLVPAESSSRLDMDPLERPDERARWRTTIHVEHATHPSLEGRRLTLGVDVEDARIAPGVSLTVVGRLAVVPPPTNPGEQDRRRGRRDRVPAMLIVPSGGLFTDASPTSNPGWWSWWFGLRSAWWQAVRTIDDAVSTVGPTTSGLVDAVLTGDRHRLVDRLRRDAEDAGVAPMLAISGWHLAIIGGFGSMLIGRHRPLGRWIAFAGVIAFAMVVVPGAGVRRAAMMVVIGGAALALGRRARGLPIVLLAGAALVCADPDIVESAGFRLSIVATIALVAGAGPARRRWFSAADRVGRRRWSMVRDRLAIVAVASIVAWTSTAPIVVATFGRVSLVGIPAAILIAPLFGAFVVAATIASGCTLVTGAAPPVLVDVVVCLATAFTTIVGGIADIAPIWRGGWPIGAASWSVVPSVALAMAPAIEVAPIRRGIAASAVIVTLVAVTIPPAGDDVLDRDRMRIDAIAVGDGTAMLVRGGGAAVLQDAGSSSVDDCGRRIIGPTLRALGVRRLDAIIVTHANADHFNAVLDVVRGVQVERIVVSPHLFARARSTRPSLLSTWLDEVHESGVAVIETQRGAVLRLGDLVWTVIHPAADDGCRTVNDESIVSSVRLDGDPAPRLLLCGDVQDEAIARVLSREPGLSATVMELPHHGSWRPIAATLLTRVDPAAVVQSTGPDRWRLDRWKVACGGRWRGVTCRDGLVSFEINGRGEVHPGSGRWIGTSRGRSVEASEEAQTRLVPAGRGATIGTRPDDHDRTVETPTLGEDGDQHAGHAFEQRRARGDPHAGLAQVERAISDGLTGLEVPGHDDLGVHGRPLGIPTVGGHGLVLPHRRIVQHGPVTSTARSRGFRRVVENSPGAGELCRGGGLGNESPSGDPRFEPGRIPPADRQDPRRSPEPDRLWSR